MTDLWTSPWAFPSQIDLPGDRVRLLHLEEGDFRAASFLDERLFQRFGEGRWVEAARLDLAEAPWPPRLDFIFHIGHVGSTLLARLLGDHPSVFALREPAPLRTLALAEPAALSPWLRRLLPLFARVWRPGQRSLVKATSFVADIGPAMTDMAEDSRAILMLVPPVTYLATILAGPDSRAALPEETASRLARVAARLGTPVEPPRGDGEAAALGWVVGVLALHALAERLGPRALWLNFDDLLAEPAATLERVFGHLGVSADASEISEIVSGQHLRQYAKAPEFAYDAEFRRRVLGQAYAERRTEIDAGLAWIDRLAIGRPELTRAMRTAAAAIAAR